MTPKEIANARQLAEEKDKEVIKYFKKHPIKLKYTIDIKESIELINQVADNEFRQRIILFLTRGLIRYPVKNKGLVCRLLGLP